MRKTILILGVFGMILVLLSGSITVGCKSELEKAAEEEEEFLKEFLGEEEYKKIGEVEKEIEEELKKGAETPTPAPAPAPPPEPALTPSETVIAYWSARNAGDFDKVEEFWGGSVPPGVNWRPWVGKIEKVKILSEKINKSKFGTFAYVKVRIIFTPEGQADPWLSAHAIPEFEMTLIPKQGAWVLCAR